MERSLTTITAPGQSKSESKGNQKVLHAFQSSNTWVP